MMKVTMMMMMTMTMMMMMMMMTKTNKMTMMMMSMINNTPSTLHQNIFYKPAFRRKNNRRKRYQRLHPYGSLLTIISRCWKA